MIDILSAFREQNLDPGTPQLDGKIHRFKVDVQDAKKSGWYVGYQNFSQKSGQCYHVVVFGNHKTDEDWTFTTGNIVLSSDDQKKQREQIAQAKKKLQAEVEKNQLQVAEEIAESWTTLLDSGESDYLRKKKIDHLDSVTLGIRFDVEGSFYVPLRDSDGKFWSLQKIQFDGFKKYYTGGRKRGCYHTLGDVEKSENIYLCEGFATGASIYDAIGEAVVIAFDGGNLVEVAATIKKVYPDKSIIVCGDDDKWGEKNLGREKAEEAAKRCLGRTAFPVFGNTDSGARPTDWNDLHILCGIEAVRKQLTELEPIQQLALYALGFNGGEYFFTSTQNRQIVGLNSFSEDNLLKLMPLEYWQAVFPSKSDKGVGIAWSQAKSELISQCQKKGIFDAGNVRGSGVWMDRGRIVVNMGDHLIVDGQRVPLGQIKSRYFYTLGKNLEELRIDPLTVSDCKTLVDACRTFKWARPKDAGVLLAGGLVTGRVCGALPYRPHIWITGGAQTGKTTLFERLVNPIMGKNRHYFIGGTTEAGVRQTLKSDALPVMFDEFESNGGQSNEKIAACIELMRASWAESGGAVVKGGATGNAAYYQLRFSAIVSSIRTRLINDADRGRFAVLELSPHGGDEDHWRKLSGYLSQIDEDFSERLFARVIKMLPIMIGNFKLLKTALAKRADSRFGDQYGMLLAGYSILLSDEKMDVGDAETLAEMVTLEEEKEIAKAADHDDCLSHLTSSSILIDRNPKSVGALISKVWKNGIGAEVERNALQTVGIRVEYEFVAVVSTGHANMENSIWRGTKWSQTWGNSLARLQGAERKKFRVDGPTRNCVIIPIKLFDIER